MDTMNNENNYRRFEIISSMAGIIDENYIPQRADNGSAGYDLKASKDIVVPSIFKNISLLSLVIDDEDKNKLKKGTSVTLDEIEVLTKKYGLRPTMIPTGLKVKMCNDEVLKIYPRSSIGVKALLTMPNNVGIIDASYYNNPDNEGHIHIPFLNFSPFDIKIRKGERIAQGIFLEYFTVDNDQPIKSERIGGFGSSNK